MSMIARGTAIRFTPLDTDGNPAGEPIITEGEVTVTENWEDSELTRRGAAINRNFINGLNDSINHWNSSHTWTRRQPDDPDLAQRRIFARNMAIALDVPPAILGIPVMSRPIPSPAARGYQKRVRARRKRNRR